MENIKEKTNLISEIINKKCFQCKNNNLYSAIDNKFQQVFLCASLITSTSPFHFKRKHRTTRFRDILSPHLTISKILWSV